MRQAIALIRVSTEGQATDDRAGLAAQRRECERIAAREDLAIAEWVELAGVSGAKVLDDARFRSLLDRLSRPGIAGLIVADFDRLFRRGRFGDYVILDAFADTGSLLFTSEGRVDPTQDTDALLSLIRGELGAMERRKIRMRTMRAKVEHRARGRHVAGAHTLPLGVRFDKSTDRWSYAPAESSLVREVFERVLSGERNFTQLAQRLGVGRTLIRRILCQPLYAGFRYLGAEGGVAREGTEQVVLDPPLVSRADWTRAQEIARVRPPPPRGLGGPRVYRGLLRCADCGARMHVHRDHAWTYRCGPVLHTMIVAHAVDAACDVALAERLARPEVVLAALAGATAEREAARPDAEESAAEAKRLIAERERVTVGFERGLRTLAEAERRTREIDAALARLELPAEPAPEAESVEALAALLAAPFAEWAYLTADQKRRILGPAVESIAVARTGRAQAAVESVRLRIPVDPAPTTPTGRRRSTWATWGGSLEVAIQ